MDCPTFCKDVPSMARNLYPEIHEGITEASKTKNLTSCYIKEFRVSRCEMINYFNDCEQEWRSITKISL